MITRGFQSPLQTDLYQLAMASVYHQKQHNPTVTFEYFVRSLPKNRDYLVFAGLAEALEAVRDMKFTRTETNYLRTLPGFQSLNESFFLMLERIRFSGDLWSIPEGTVIQAGMPIIRVTAPLIEAQLLETYLLSVCNFSTSVASKAARMVNAIGETEVSLFEFGSRRAHGPEAGILAARSAFVAGFKGTSNVEAGIRHNIPVVGTMAHSFVTAFPTEEEAFNAFYEVFPETSVFLVDTYNTEQAIDSLVGTEVQGIRIDSGDLAAHAVYARNKLGPDVKIILSNDMNEHTIASILERTQEEGVLPDGFGVGTALSTSKDAPALGGVYKLVAIHTENGYVGTLKNSPGKPSYPGVKQVHQKDGVFTVALENEFPDQGTLLEQIYDQGFQIKPDPTLEEIQQYCLGQLNVYSKVKHTVQYSKGVEDLRQQVLTKLGI